MLYPALHTRPLTPLRTCSPPITVMWLLALPTIGALPASDLEIALTSTSAPTKRPLTKEVASGCLADYGGLRGCGVPAGTVVARAQDIVGRATDGAVVIQGEDIVDLDAAHVL